jgi:AcrR family transcriptional regulator
VKFTPEDLSQRQQFVPTNSREKNDELVRDAAVRLLSTAGLEGTNFNSVSLDAGLSNSVLRKRFGNTDDLLVDVWKSRCFTAILLPISIVVATYLSGSEASPDPQSRALLNSLFELEDDQLAGLEILAISASHDQVMQAIAPDFQSLYSQEFIDSPIRQAQFVVYFEFILGTLMHFRAQLLDRELLVARLHELLTGAIVPAQDLPIPEVDASYIRQSFVPPAQSANYRLMNACLESVAKYGFAQTTTKMIAKASGFSEGKLFASYPSKLELFLDSVGCQLGAGFQANFEATEQWTNQYGIGMTAAILLREYHRGDLDLQRALQVEFLRLAWHRSDMFERRLSDVNRAMQALGVAATGPSAPAQEVEQVLMTACGTGSLIVARLDREAWRLPFAAATAKIYF